MIEVRWHGRGGQGCWTAARLLGLAAVKFEGKYALAFPSFGPERRGAPILGFTKIDDQRIRDRSEVKSCDYIVVLDETLIEEDTCKGLKKNGIVVINSASAAKYMNYFRGVNIKSIDATSIALKILGKPITNTAMLGALVAASGIVSLDAVKSAILQEMKESIQEKNVQVVKLAYDEAGRAE
ncbi:MAG: 2-oxoacid:acceptor oxidoreductase family protein [Spirochaetes bacterium]|nr:2-oxoacid:acceptor oxidoreductase family protein [Spirochaetota bacterium]